MPRPGPLPQTRPSNDDICAILCNFCDVFACYAAVDFDITGIALFVDDAPQLPNLRDGLRNEALAAKARLHGHNQHHVKFRQQRQDLRKRRAGPDGHGSLRAQFPDAADLRARVALAFPVHRHNVRAGGNEFLQIAVRFADHQMHI